jgi:hypothetical protein
MAKAVTEFGFREVEPAVFTEFNRVIRMGMPPLRIEVLTTISGVDFSVCFGNRVTSELGGVPVNMIGLDDLKANKKASAALRI